MANKDEFGVEFSDDKKTLVQCPLDFHGEYKIPDGVGTIKEGAFYGRSGLTSIVIPGSVGKIEADAFNGCTCLTSIAIYNNNIEIDDNAFCPIYGRGTKHVSYLALPLKFVKPYRDEDSHSWKTPMEKIFGCVPRTLIITGDEKHIDFSKLYLPHSINIYINSEIESLILPDDFAERTKKEDIHFYVNNFIDNVDVKGEGVDKYYDDDLLFRAPKPSCSIPFENPIELTLNERSIYFHYNRRWSAPVTIDIHAITYFYPIEMKCYDEKYSGTRILLCGTEINEEIKEHMCKTQSYPYIDVWEPYEHVRMMLEECGWPNGK